MTSLTQHPASLLVTVAVLALLVRLGLAAFRRQSTGTVSVATIPDAFRCYGMCFIAGVLITNFLAHFPHGISGEQFPSPFGFVLKSSVGGPLANVVWGLLNLVLGYGFLARADAMQLGTRWAAACFTGMLTMGVFLALVFSR